MPLRGGVSIVIAALWMTLASSGGHQGPQELPLVVSAVADGGIPKPLFGELVGGFSAELEGGSQVEGVRAVRFEHAFPCGSDALARITTEARPP